MVRCDVVEMDVCHILLGKPWQYDVSVTHKVKPSVYFFEWKGRKIALMPIANTPVPIENPRSKRKLLLSTTAKHSIRETSKDKVMFAIIAKEQPPEVNAHSPLVIQLLNEYTDLLHEELPSELPPIREIKHNIDIIPGSSLPNLPHYRLSPQEHEILLGMIDGLLKKNLLQESVCPCAVPILLVQKKDGIIRICVDSRVVNKITVKYKFPIQRIEDMLDKMQG